MSQPQRQTLPTLSHAEVIRRVQEACDTLVEDATRGHRPPVSCRAGCDHCCKQPVFVTPLEGLAIRDFLQAANRVPQTRRDGDRYLVRLRSRPQGETGLKALQRSVQGLGPPPNERQRRAVYGVDCMFLQNGRCSIYPVRPLMCREHISFDDPDKCRRDEPFLGLDKPRFSEVSSYLTRSVGPRDLMRPIWEYEQSAATADATGHVRDKDLRKALKWKTGR